MLDLHELFEADGNDPDARTAVLDTVECLVKDGFPEAAMIFCLVASRPCQCPAQLQKLVMMSLTPAFD
jgi:hypothetical protein